MTRAALLAVAAPLLGATAGCRVSDDWDCPAYESPCPARFDVRTFCNATQACTLNGTALATLDGAPQITSGDTLSIPIADFAAELGGHDLFLMPVSVEIADPYAYPDVCTFTTARLDGVAATTCLRPNPVRLYASSPSASFRWAPFPAHPQVLEISYVEDLIFAQTYWFWFEDGACEDANPAPICYL